MSKGTQVYSVRIPSELSSEISKTINRRNLFSKEGPWTFTDFILMAVREKLAHMERSRTKGKKKIKEPKQEPIADGGVLHRDPREAEFWQGIEDELWSKEREAINGQS